MAYACLHMHTHPYSVQCSEKNTLSQLLIKCGIAKSCPGTDPALQAPMMLPVRVPRGLTSCDLAPKVVVELVISEVTNF